MKDFERVQIGKVEHCTWDTPENTEVANSPNMISGDVVLYVVQSSSILSRQINKDLAERRWQKSDCLSLSSPRSVCWAPCLTMDATYPLYPILTFVFFLAILVPLPAHLQSKNVGTSCFIVWMALGLLSQFVNSIVWRKNALNPSPGWCDFCEMLIQIFYAWIWLFQVSLTLDGCSIDCYTLVLVGHKP